MVSADSTTVNARLLQQDSETHEPFSNDGGRAVPPSASLVSRLDSRRDLSTDIKYQLDPD